MTRCTRPHEKAFISTVTDVRDNLRRWREGSFLLWGLNTERDEARIPRDNRNKRGSEKNWKSPSGSGQQRAPVLSHERCGGDRENRDFSAMGRGHDRKVQRTGLLEESGTSVS